MAWSYVTIDRQGPVAVVRFDRKENLNAFNQQLVRELTETARSFHDDLDTHYVVLAGAAEAFSAGPTSRTRPPGSSRRRRTCSAATASTRAYGSAGRGRTCRRSPSRPWSAWRWAPASPSRSPATGVCSDGARSSACRRSRSVSVCSGALPRLVTLVGPARAKRITLMAEKMDAQTALGWGLVDELAQDGRTVETALAMARKTAEMPPATVRLMKEAINATAGALHRATSFADGDQSQLTGFFEAARTARERFHKR